VTYVIRMTSELGSLAEGGIRGTGTFVSLFLAGTVRGPSGSAADRVIERRTHSSARYEELTAILSGRPRALSALYLFTHITGPASLKRVLWRDGVFSLFGCKLHPSSTS
jgi:hypothetical protein